MKCAMNYRPALASHLPNTSSSHAHLLDIIPPQLLNPNLRNRFILHSQWRLLVPRREEHALQPATRVLGALDHLDPQPPSLLAPHHLLPPLEVPQSPRYEVAREGVEEPEEGFDEAPGVEELVVRVGSKEIVERDGVEEDERRGGVEEPGEQGVGEAEWSDAVEDGDGDAESCVGCELPGLTGSRDRLTDADREEVGELWSRRSQLAVGAKGRCQQAASRGRLRPRNVP